MYRPFVVLNHQWWCMTPISGIYCWLYLSRKRLLSPENFRGPPYATSCNIFGKSFKQIDFYISSKKIEVYTIQAVMCHPGHISRNKSDRQVLKKSQGHPYVTSCNIFCKSFKQIDVFKSPKTLNYIQYRLLCVTQETYRATKVIAESWKSPRDVHIRRPAIYFQRFWIAFPGLSDPFYCIVYIILFFGGDM